MKISLRRRHALTGADGAFSHKIGYVPIFLGDSKSRRALKLHNLFKRYGNFAEWSRFCPLVELHREGSAPAACAAGLFLYVQGPSSLPCVVIWPKWWHQRGACGQARSLCTVRLFNYWLLAPLHILLPPPLYTLDTTGITVHITLLKVHYNCKQ